MTAEPAPFADQLRALRRSRGLTQDELAEAARVGARSISDLERGLSLAPRRDTVALLIQALGLGGEERAAFVAAARAGRAGLAHGHSPRLLDPLQMPGLPAPLVGRTKDVAAVVALLGRDDIRLVTLTGPPGIGKTSLAIQVATDVAPRFPDGAAFVGLADVREPATVLPAIARTLGVMLSEQESPLEALAHRLGPLSLLIVLDNLEQITEAGPLIAALSERLTTVKFLATSRALLRVRMEHEYTVSPLTVPHSGAALALPEIDRYSALRLFVDRAQATYHGFQVTPDSLPVLAQICRRLDGLPLAIELAASRARGLSLPQLLDRLDHSLSLLVGGANDLPARQRTLRAAIAWSHDLLPPAEQQLFSRLAVFAGGCTLESAEEVCGPDLPMTVLDGLTSLLDKHLVQRREGAAGEVRFTLLETVRAYALERLTAGGEADAQRTRHAVHYASLTAAVDQALQGAGQAEWLHRIDQEQDNVREALRWARESRDAALGLSIAGTMWRVWETHGQLTEGRAWLTEMLALDEDPGVARHGDVSARAVALNAEGLLALRQGDYVDSARVMHQCLALRRQLDDLAGVVVALNGIANVAVYQGEYSEAITHYEEALAFARRTGTPRPIAAILGNLAFVANEGGRCDEAETLVQESLVLRRRIKDDAGTALGLATLADVALHRGEFEVAETYVDQSVAIYREQSSPTGAAYAVLTLTEAAMRQHQLERADGLATECLAVFRGAGVVRGCGIALTTLGETAYLGGDFDRARACLDEALGIFLQTTDRIGVISVLEAQARLALGEGDRPLAARLYGKATLMREGLGVPPWPVDREHHERDLGALGGRDAVVAAAVAPPAAILPRDPVDVTTLLPPARPALEAAGAPAQERPEDRPAFDPAGSTPG